MCIYSLVLTFGMANTLLKALHRDLETKLFLTTVPDFLVSVREGNSSSLSEVWFWLAYLRIFMMWLSSNIDTWLFLFQSTSLVLDAAASQTVVVSSQEKRKLK